MTDEEEREWKRQIGQRIITARKELGMSQVELSELVDCSERSMQAYESGQVLPYRKLRELAAALNRTTHWILHGQDPNQTADAELVKELISEVRQLRDEVTKLLVKLA